MEMSTLCSMDELDVKAIESKKNMLNGTKCLKYNFMKI